LSFLTVWALIRWTWSWCPTCPEARGPRWKVTWPAPPVSHSASIQNKIRFASRRDGIARDERVEKDWYGRRWERAPDAFWLYVNSGDKGEEISSKFDLLCGVDEDLMKCHWSTDSVFHYVKCQTLVFFSFRTWNKFFITETDYILTVILLKNARFAKIIPPRPYRRDFRANDKRSVVTDWATGRSDHRDDRMETIMDM
jgi:hypothetical protein